MIATPFTHKSSTDLVASLTCIDRAILKGHLMPLCHGGGPECFVDRHLRLPALLARL